MQRFLSEYGYTGPDGEHGAALPLPFDASVDPAATAVPVFVAYPDTAHGGFYTTVRTIKRAVPGKPDTFFRVADFALGGVVA